MFSTVILLSINREIKFSRHFMLQGAYDKFPDFFCMGTFIDSTHMKL